MKPLLKPRKYAGGGIAAWGLAGSAASSKFGNFMNGGFGQAAGGAMDMLDKGLDFLALKRMQKKQEEELARQKNFEEEVNTSAKARAGAIAAGLYDRDAGSTAIASAQASIANLPNYPGPDTPSNNYGAQIQLIGQAAVSMGTNLYGALKKQPKGELEPGVVDSSGGADPNNQAGNPAGDNVVESDLPTEIVSSIGKDPKAKPVGTTVKDVRSFKLKTSAFSKNGGTLMPKFTITSFQAGGKAGKWGAVAKAATDIGNAVMDIAFDKTLKDKLQRLAVAKANNEALRAETEQIVADAKKGKGADFKKAYDTSQMPVSQESAGSPLPPQGKPAQSTTATSNPNDLAQVASQAVVTAEGQRPVVTLAPTVRQDLTIVTNTADPNLGKSTVTPDVRSMVPTTVIAEDASVTGEDIATVDEKQKEATANAKAVDQLNTQKVDVVIKPEGVDASAQAETPGTETEVKKGSGRMQANYGDYINDLSEIEGNFAENVNFQLNGKSYGRDKQAYFNAIVDDHNKRFEEGKAKYGNDERYADLFTDEAYNKGLQESLKFCITDLAEDNRARKRRSFKRGGGLQHKFEINDFYKR